MTVDQANAYIDTNVKDLATARAAMKQIAAAIINMRGLFIMISKLVICIRDITIKK